MLAVAERRERPADPLPTLYNKRKEAEVLAEMARIPTLDELWARKEERDLQGVRI